MVNINNVVDYLKQNVLGTNCEIVEVDGECIMIEIYSTSPLIFGIEEWAEEILKLGTSTAWIDVVDGNIIVYIKIRVLPTDFVLKNFQG